MFVSVVAAVELRQVDLVRGLVVADVAHIALDVLAIAAQNAVGEPGALTPCDRATSPAGAGPDAPLDHSSPRR